MVRFFSYWFWLRSSMLSLLERELSDRLVLLIGNNTRSKIQNLLSNLFHSQQEQFLMNSPFPSPRNSDSENEFQEDSESSSFFIAQESSSHFSPSSILIFSGRKRIGCSWKRTLKGFLFIVLVTGIALFIGFSIFGGDSFHRKTEELFTTLKTLPTVISCLLVILLYCVALILICPGTPFNLASGFLYGVLLGCFVSLIGCLLGATIAFLFGRSIGREWIKSKMDRNAKFKAVDWAIQKNGVYIVFLTRLSPLFPFPLLNYAFGITKVKMWQYIIGTFTGIVPATVAYTYLGTLMRNLADMWSSMSFSVNGEESSSDDLIWFIAGLFITISSIIIISYITKRAISKATKEYEMLYGGNAAELEDNLENGTFIVETFTSTFEVDESGVS